MIPSCRSRNPGGSPAARFTEDNSVLCPETFRAWHESLLAAGCLVADRQVPCAPACHALLAHPSRLPLTPLKLSVTRARARG